LKEKITGIILAGGQSRRMGIEKGLVQFGDQPLIQRAISVLKENCSEILISANSSSYNHLELKVIPDLIPDSGPMGGIYSCLMTSGNRKNLVLSCDMPFIKPGIFRVLAHHIGDALICVPWHEGEHFEPLCGIYLKDCLPGMKDFIDNKNYKLPELFAHIKFKGVPVNTIHPPLPHYYFLNINSPADLARAMSLGVDK
jgi:molybdenum cofactor guanylyltransferase